ncbi:hypothetical protein CL658_01325 [bacterium]|nr:hypothetical protein [bacterium]
MNLGLFNRIFSFFIYILILCTLTYDMDFKIINKLGLAKKLGNYMGWSQKESLYFIEHCFDWIKLKMIQGNRVILSGFGVFQLNFRKKRRLLHPITQKPLIIPERLCPQFTPADSLLKLFNRKAIL